MGLSRLKDYSGDDWTIRLRRGWSGWIEDGVHNLFHEQSTGVFRLLTIQRDAIVTDLDLGEMALGSNLRSPSSFQTKGGFTGAVYGPAQGTVADRVWLLRKDRYLLNVSITGFFPDETARASEIDHMIQSLKLTHSDQAKEKD